MQHCGSGCASCFSGLPSLQICTSPLVQWLRGCSSHRRLSAAANRSVRLQKMRRLPSSAFCRSMVLSLSVLHLSVLRLVLLRPASRSASTGSEAHVALSQGNAHRRVRRNSCGSCTTRVCTSRRLRRTPRVERDTPQRHNSTTGTSCRPCFHKKSRAQGRSAWPEWRPCGRSGRPCKRNLHRITRPSSKFPVYGVL